MPLTVAEAQLYAIHELEHKRERLRRKPNSLDCQRVRRDIEDLEKLIVGLRAFEGFLARYDCHDNFGWPEREIDSGKFLPSNIGTRKTGYHN